MLTCENCHKGFDTKNSAKRFCSAACAMTATNRARRSLPQEIPCEFCRHVFTPARARSRYCSQSCAASANNPKKAGQRKQPGVNCHCCGKEFQPRGREARKYCSNKCQATHHWETVGRPKVLNGEGTKITCRRYLIEQFGEVCALCGLPATWHGKPLTLQLDHKDGDSDNWAVANLRLLCPNCHTQTETYGAKGTGNRVKKQTKRNQYLRKVKGYA